MNKLVSVFCCFAVTLLGFFGCEHSTRTYNEGAVLYQKHCANCHMDDGSGLEALYPPLAAADLLKSLDIRAACVIRNGLQGRIVVNGIEYETGMAAIKQLSDVELTNILNYIHNAWGNKRRFIQLKEVKAVLKVCS